MTHWRDLAACKDGPAPMFADYPHYGPGLAICARCPVVTECRIDGAHEAWGIWGGTVPEQRGYVNGQVCHTSKRTRRLLALMKDGVLPVRSERMGA